MSSIVDTLSLYDLTKKDKVIYLAKKDPFLKVEKLAQLAETSPHYVRTVLSEASLSLTKLRKEYARKIEGKEVINRLLLDILNIDEFDELNLSFQDEIVVNDKQKYINIMGKDVYNLENTILLKDNDCPVMVNTTFVGNKKRIKQFYLLKDRANIVFSNPKLKLEQSNEILSKLLEIEVGSNVLVLEKEIFINEELKGLDLLYLISSKLELSLEGNNNQIRVIKSNK